MYYKSFLLFIAIISVNGCATAPPPWHGGFLDSLADYYDQGTGGGRTIERADRNAQIALVGYQQGIEIESVLEDQVRSFQKDGDELVVEIVTSEGVQRIAGALPAGSYVAERWRDGSGHWWSYVVSERSGRSRRIQELRDARLLAARLRAVAPGWAQFSKGQKSKGWKILTAEGIGVVGWATCAILQYDYKDRRDRANKASDYDYYDDWGNRFYWGSVGFGTVAGATYLYSLIDGITSVPPTYRLLLSKVHWGVEPQSDGLALTLRYDLR